jgi:transglutaminase-like putative cysteine protease
MYMSAIKRLGDRVGNITLTDIPPGKQGTFETLKMMAALVREYKMDPGMRELAIGLAADVPPKDTPAEINAIFEYVRDQIRYIGDVSDIETLHIPPLIVEQAAGDCDDKSLLLCTLLESIGYKTRFRAVSMPQDEGLYSHVLADVRIGTVWVALETTEDVPMGWTPPDVVRELPMYN